MIVRLDDQLLTNRDWSEDEFDLQRNNRIESNGFRIDDEFMKELDKISIKR